jgi:hypothetical protein
MMQKNSIRKEPILNNIILFYSALVIMIVAVFFTFIRKNIKKKRGNKYIKEVKGRNKLYLLYRFFSTCPVLKNEFSKVRLRASLLYPSDDVQVNREATKLMLKPSIIFVAITTLSILFGRNDIYFIVLGIFIAFILFKGSITGLLEKSEYKLLVQFSGFISNLISVYREMNGQIDDAIYSMLDSLPLFVSMHVAKMYEILTSAHMEEAAAAYTDMAPNNYMLSFISLAVPTKIYGDKVLEDGNTTFIKGLMNLKKQLDEEILKRRRRDNAFASLTWIPTAVVFFLKPIEFYFVNYMPQTVSFFEGSLGTFMMTLIIFTAYICYSLVLTLKTGRRKDVKENSIWKKMVETNPWLNATLNVQYAKHYTKLYRIEKKMIAVGDRTGIKAHIMKCVTAAAAMFVVVNILFVTADFQAAHNSLNNFRTTFDNTVVPDDSYTNEMQSMAAILANEHKHDDVSDAEVQKQMESEVRENSKILKSESYVAPVVEAAEASVVKYNNIYFRWYYEIIAIIMAIVAFQMPTWFLNFNTKTMEMAKEDEVNSFNLLAMTFMDMDSIQVPTLLEWMERFAYNYKSDISECIVNYEMGEQKALDKLLESDTLPDFQKFVRCMESVDKVGFKNAFFDIEIQEDYYNAKKKDEDDALTRKEASLASKIAFIPLWITLIGWILLPMAMYGLSLYSQFKTVLNK